MGKKKKSALQLPLSCVSRAVYQTHKSNFKTVFGSYKHMTLKLDRYAALKAIPCFTLSHGYDSFWSGRDHDGSRRASGASLMCYSPVLHFGEHVNSFKFNSVGTSVYYVLGSSHGRKKCLAHESSYLLAHGVLEAASESTEIYFT